MQANREIDNNTDAKGRGSDLSNATQTDPIRTRDDLGAALKSIANIERLFGVNNSGAEQEVHFCEADNPEGKWVNENGKVYGEEELLFRNGDI